mmetsp:Transcript_3804/g.11125  ORF Transcript_3804/g.11125 Transcript_3804/m.11125 type:complete len:262 (-) Transcript_3804:2122-2907(-)
MAAEQWQWGSALKLGNGFRHRSSAFVRCLEHGSARRGEDFLRVVVRDRSLENRSIGSRVSSKTVQFKEHRLFHAATILSSLGRCCRRGLTAWDFWRCCELGSGAWSTNFRCECLEEPAAAVALLCVLHETPFRGRRSSGGDRWRERLLVFQLPLLELHRVDLTRHPPPPRLMSLLPSGLHDCGRHVAEQLDEGLGAGLDVLHHHGLVRPADLHLRVVHAHRVHRGRGPEEFMEAAGDRLVAGVSRGDRGSQWSEVAVLRRS